MNDASDQPSPYAAPDPLSPGSDAEEPVLIATLVREPAQPLSLQAAIHHSPLLMILMTALVMGAATVAYVMTSVIAMGLAMWALGEFPADGEVGIGPMSRVMQDRVGIFLAILPPQLAMLVVPLLAGFLLLEGPRRGLRLVRGRWPIWVWFAAAAATPLVGLLSSLLVSGFAEESEALEMLSDAFRAHGKSGFLIPLALLIGLTPAICEEVLFRGFLQPRLSRLIPAWLAVFLASLAFAAYHFDPVHVIAVLPLGLWLGFLSYRSGSLFPAMLGHFVNNVLSVIGVIAEDSGALDTPGAILAIPILLGGVLGILAVIYASLRWRVEPAEA